jgi:DNA modification methylase
MSWEIRHGECLEVMRAMPDNSVDAVVTDPPYGLSFMGKKWDYDVPSVEVWEECLRVLKPGGHLLAFAGTRTQHRMAVRIEDAGFEIRDMIAWVYGSGFPKSLDVSKAIDKAAGAERDVLSETWRGAHAGVSGGVMGTPVPRIDVVTAPATPDAARWQGWGTALKPALEPITMARKPLTGTVAANVLEHGTGSINVDGCRVGTSKEVPGAVAAGNPIAGGNSMWKGLGDRQLDTGGMNPNVGRWPANLIHDGSDEVVGLFPVTTSGKLQAHHATGANPWVESSRPPFTGEWGGDSGSAARFFYCAKANKADRDEGCEGLAERVAGVGDVDESSGRDSTKPGNQYGEGSRRRVEAGLSPTMPRRNHHPTVKPTDLMRYLCRLVTPPNGTVLDPFTGSGSTGKAATLEGFNFIGIEREAEYVEIARARIHSATPHQPDLFS